MPDTPQISSGQALEGFPGQISVKINGCHVAQNMECGLNVFLLAMPDEPQISFGQALEAFQGQISVKVNWCHVAQNIVRGSNFFCWLCLLSLKSVLVKLWRDFKAK